MNLAALNRRVDLPPEREPSSSGQPDNIDGNTPLDQLFPLVLHELKGLAQMHMRGQTHSQSLQATALVNEVYVRLAERDGRWNDRTHFMRLAGRVMRQVITDRARSRRTLKRQQPGTRVPLDDLVDAYEQRAIDMIDLDDCLSDLAVQHQNLVDIVELRFFAGRSLEEIAAILDTSIKTVYRRWLAVKALLRKRLG